MLNPLETLQQIFIAPAPELAMLGDKVEIDYGFTTMVGIVTEGDPYLDSFGDTWFKVSGIVFGNYGQYMTSIWVTDEAVLRIIERA